MYTSSATPSSLILPTIHSSSLLRHRNISIFTSSRSLLSQHGFRTHTVRFSASVVADGRNVDVSWFPPPVSDDYGGWAFVESPIIKRKKGVPRIVIAGVGTSIAILLAAIAHFSLSRKGFRFQFGGPFHALNGILRLTGREASNGKTTDSSASEEDFTFVEASPEDVADTFTETLESAYVEKAERVIIPAAVDQTQLEALSVLNKLKVIEDDIKADKLCTRREYARWLVRANSLLERNPKRKIVPSILLSGSITAAFDDITVEDPDFGSIQALAEAGVILSKLAGHNSRSNLDVSEGHGGIYFYPERYLSRQDLIDWKTQLDYEFNPIPVEKILQTKVGLMDVREISADASPGLFTDMLSGDKSILRRVFGHIKRFQPNKPSTVAQAAVTLTSGKMTEAIQAELARLEAENVSRLIEMEEIRSELLDRGDIRKFWDQKLDEAKAHGFDVGKAYLAATHDLGQEKIIQEKFVADYLKEKAAMDCQKQLLLSLKEEVSEMSKRLEFEKANYVTEQCHVQDMLTDLQSKVEGLLDAKSILEAEREAFRILRSWLEDEARKSKARAKVLEEVVRRWRWESQA